MAGADVDHAIFTGRESGIKPPDADDDAAIAEALEWMGVEVDGPMPALAPLADSDIEWTLERRPPFVLGNDALASAIVAAESYRLLAVAAMHELHRLHIHIERQRAIARLARRSR